MLRIGSFYNIMAFSQRWQYLDGQCVDFSPQRAAFKLYQMGRMTLGAYLFTYNQRLLDIFGEDIKNADRGFRSLMHTRILWTRISRTMIPVVSGDSLVCSCSSARARSWRCHRTFAALTLWRCGITVTVDGLSMKRMIDKLPLKPTAGVGAYFNAGVVVPNIGLGDRWAT